ncbi:MAG TPA: ABC transporter substrate-binding protein [Bradyrhizobium sp.]|nr:ABC transporter substrate-binding protein [Bradyrhizobium sp.]
MKRREFIRLVVGATASAPFAALAQRKLPTIGFLGSASPLPWKNYVAAFEQRLHELGWLEGKTVAIEYRWAEGRSERFVEISAEFVRLKVDVIVTGGSAALAVKQATSEIPIVFVLGADPLGSGLVKSLSRPGGNVTGLSVQANDIVGKRLELLREVLPGLHRLAIIANPANPQAASELDEVQTEARAIGFEPIRLEIRRAEDFAPALEVLKGRADALYTCGDALTRANAARISTLALAARLPTIFYAKEYLESGGLMSYGPSTPDQFRRSADFVDKILRGTKPGDIPVEQPTKLELAFNLKTAKALGLEVPPTLLARADEVIE